jgi:serine protease Do
MYMKLSLSHNPKQDLTTVLVAAITSCIVFCIGILIMHLLKTEPKPAVEQTSSASLYTSKVAYENTIMDTVDKSNPAVVSIIISKDVPVIEQRMRSVNPFGDIFGPGSPFGGFGFPGFSVPEYTQKGVENKEVGGGSGFLVSADGLIVTNKHVVSDTDATYTVYTSTGKKFPATVVARDSLFDIAVLRIKGDGFPYLKLGNSKSIRLGQTVIAIGNALSEFKNSVSVGVISGLSRSITAGDGYGHTEQLNNVIQTDAAINPGNSGGPLLDLNGFVIGVNVAAAQGSENIGFALPSGIVAKILSSIQKTGSIERAYLGIRYVAITPELAEKNNLAVDYGVLVQRGETMNDLAVIPGSPADKAGLRQNDIILAVDGVDIKDNVLLHEVVGEKPIGSTLRLHIERQGKRIIIPITLEKIPENIKKN